MSRPPQPMRPDPGYVEPTSGPVVWVVVGFAGGLGSALLGLAIALRLLA